MSNPPKKPTKGPSKLREPADVRPPEPYMSVVAGDDLGIPERIRDACDRALAAGGTAVDVSDGRKAWRVYPKVLEAAIVNLE